MQRRDKASTTLTQLAKHKHASEDMLLTHSLPLRAVSSDSSGTSHECLRMTGCTCLATLSSSSLLYKVPQWSRCQRCKLGSGPGSLAW
jgi:hypothetical protein